jgi:parallel beta-helix repeat protein
MHRKHARRARLALACVAWALLAAPAALAQTTFYVDNQSGTCSPNGPGTSAKPYCTISAAISAHKGAGITILVRPGTYRETVTLNASGTAGNPFVIQGLPTPGNPVTIDGADDLSAASNWMLSSGTVYVTSSVTWGTPSQVFSDGVRLTPSSASPNSLPVGTWRFVSGAGLYVNVGGNPSTHLMRVGRRLYGFRLSTKNYVTVDGFTVTGTEDRAIYLSNNADNCVISNNTVTFSNRYGIQVNSCNGVLIASNYVSDGNDHGIAITASSTGCTIQNNESLRNADPTQRRANGIYLNRSTNNLLQGNRVHDNQDTGMDFETGANYNTSLQNFSWNNGDHGYDHVEGTNNTHIGDVAYGNYKDGFSIEGQTPGTHLTNCIAVDNGLTTNEFDLWVDAQSSVGFVSDYNIFWNSTSQPPVKYIATLYSSVATYSANSGQDAHSIQANPMFVNPAAGDFRLQAGSPAIDNASSGVPFWPSLDASGHARVDDPSKPNVGVGPVTFADRGALEYLANQAPTVGAPLTISTGEAAPLSFSVSASDPEGDAIVTLMADLGQLPAGNNAAFTAGAGNTSGTFSWTPTYVDSRPAPYNVTFTASNAGSGSATTAITVTNTDRAPVVTAPATATAAEAAAVSITIGASDPDGTSITSLSANTSGLPAGNNAAFSAGAGNTSGTFTWTPTYSDGRPAPYTVTFSASNALSGSAATAITVTNVDRAP